MKRIFLLAVLAFVLVSAQAAKVTNLVTTYRNGQTFAVWKIITGYTGFYYVYRSTSPITNANIDNATYLGRTPYDFSFNYYLDLSFKNIQSAPSRYLVINNNPTQKLDATQGLFVATCGQNKTYYYAVTSDNANGNEDRTITPGANATTNGVAESIAPIKGILQIAGTPLINEPSLLYDAYVVFGGNVTTTYTPTMTNEGCLDFNYGIVKDKKAANPNGITFFYYGGGGNAYTNCNDEVIDGMWKLSLEDDIPNFNWDATNGENTKWIGYNENFDVYTAGPSTPWPTTGTDHLYALSRIKWTYDWLVATFPTEIDFTKVYGQGSSEGTTGALLFAYNFPDLVAAVSVTVAKVNGHFLYDDNPSCKWNLNGTTRKKQNIFIGDYIHNLPTDYPKLKGSGNYKMYDMMDFNVLLKDQQKTSLPIVTMVSGKNDDVTCWDEKIPYYETVNNNQSGGFYFWDLRSHNSGSEMIPDQSTATFLRYRTDLSYPAFSNCSADGYPGDTINPNPPYYDGDSIGTKYGTLDWIDTSIHETKTSWQGIIYSHQFKLKNGQMFPFNLPQTSTTDITLRRLQKFKNVANNTKICMDNYKNGKIIQTKSITYSTSTGLITFKGVKINQGAGDLIKIYECGSSSRENFSTDAGLPTAAIEKVYPNPTTGQMQLYFSTQNEENVSIVVKNILGQSVLQMNEGVMAEGDHTISFNLSSFASNMYIVELHAGKNILSYKIMKN
ncbi:MAG: T9SS type A sorting domain-containing protein [Chitinophagales bacterium]|nr:T9SS type A sorting domain-containing protein [Chitinophagales bacterium]